MLFKNWLKPVTFQPVCVLSCLLLENLTALEARSMFVKILLDNKHNWPAYLPVCCVSLTWPNTGSYTTKRQVSFSKSSRDEQESNTSLPYAHDMATVLWILSEERLWWVDWNSCCLCAVGRNHHGISAKLWNQVTYCILSLSAINTGFFLDFC